MGRRKKRAPRRGSLAYLPRGRAKSPVGKINYWPEVDADSPRLLGFAGYKVGMSFVFQTGTKRGSPTFGQEIYSPVTFIESPPIFVCGFRSYSQTAYGKKTLTETWTKKSIEGLKKLPAFPKKVDDFSLKEIQANLDKVSELRAILCTQPHRVNVPQKKPSIFEVKVGGGTLKEQFEYLKNLLGREIEVSEIFKEGQFVDVIAVTKGKGIQGPVKRWGVKKRPHKSRKTVRGVGTLGPWSPHYVMYSVPRAGQMGFHQRTEINKKILKIERKAQVFAVKGGFPHYGVIQESYLILKGSIPGPSRRLVKLRCAARPPISFETIPNLTHIEIQQPNG